MGQTRFCWGRFDHTLSDLMVEKSYLLMGLLAAVFYAFAASSLKAAADRGVRSMQSALLANLAIAVAFLAFVPWREPTFTPPEWWRAVAVGTLIFTGQLFTMLALRRGHASIATPTMGSKVVLVALVLSVFHRAVPANVWMAAGLVTVGIVILAWPTEHLPWRRIVPAVGFAMLAALSFGTFDVLTQIWSLLPGYTFGRLIPWAMVFAAGITAAMDVAMDRRPRRTGVPRQRRRMFDVPREARGFLALGVFLLTLQSLVLIGSIGYFHDAAGLNVVYGSRGVMSVLIVWLVGHWFSQHERIHSRGLLARRLTAAGLIGAAVCLVFF